MKLRTQIAFPIVGALLLGGSRPFRGRGGHPHTIGGTAGRRLSGRLSRNRARPPRSRRRFPRARERELVLKDGTFQMAREYSVEGDRLRYWSVERSQWEEIPENLVDWDATHKGEGRTNRA